MAKFKKVKIDPQHPDVWGAIRTEMLLAQSVELVAVPGPNGKVVIEIRAWSDVRNDGSNADKASGEKDY